MKSIPLVASLVLLLLFSCSKTDKDAPIPELSEQFVNGELAEVAKQRGLNSDDLVAAVKTFNPSGVLDEYLAFFGTGVSGRLAVVGMPSMRILKYVAVFSAEPWQGFAFDDESKAIISNSSREEISYGFGDMGKPALSLTQGQHDGRAVFIADAANGRLGIVDLAEYETKQIVTHPLFHQSSPDIAVTPETQYVVQTSGSAVDAKDSKNRPVAGATFWRFVEKESDAHKTFFIDPASSFTVVLPAGPQSSPVLGRSGSDGIMLNISQGNEPYLNVIKWKVAEGLVGTKAVKVNNHFIFNEKTASETSIFFRHKLPAGSNNIIVSGDGKFAAITNKNTSSIQIIELKSLLVGQLVASAVEVGGPSVDAAFTSKNLYVTVNNPNQFVRITLANKVVKNTHSLDFPAGKISIPTAETLNAEDKYAVVANHSPYGRFTRVGPQSGLSAHLLDIRADKIQGIYNASIPQTTRLSAVAMSTKINKPVFRYKIGTDPRSGLISSYKATSGKETVVRDGKRVHVYATVIRSHITPDYIEVEQGDTVSIHITSTEQARDTTHGFTIDTYDVHGSFEPGKTASVTFVADRAGVFPFYCTEFCSALHLEMQGYLLVKPSSNYEISSLMTSQNNPQMKSFFKYIKGE